MNILFILFIFIALVSLGLSFFIFPQLSPIPYFPSNKKDLGLIIKALNLKNNQTIIDLGAGDGIVVFEAAKKAFQEKLKTQFIAVEINPILVLILHLKRLFHPNKKNIIIIWQDMFKIKLKIKNSKLKTRNLKFEIKNNNLLTIERGKDITIYLYISPWYLDKVIRNLKLEIKNFKVLSYMYPIKSLKPSKLLKGKNSLYIYHIK